MNSYALIARKSKIFCVNTSEQFNINYTAKTLENMKQETVKMAYSVLHQSMPTRNQSTKIQKHIVHETEIVSNQT